MTKHSRSDEEEPSAVESAGEGTLPPVKKTKKATEKKTEKKATKLKKATKESSASGSGSKKGNVAKNVFTNSSGEKFVDLGKKKRVSISNFKGSIYVDIREYYGNDDDLHPGKKGIALSAEQWAELKANADTIDDLLQKATA